MSWLLLSLISAFFAATVNYTDKYLISRVLKDRGIGALIIFSSLIGLPIALIVLIFHRDVFLISPQNVIILLLNGILYISWVLPYLYALEKDEASVVAPLFQLSSVFSLILGYLFLNEQLNNMQLGASLLILFGALGLTIEFTKDRKFEIKINVLILMLLSAFLVALNALIFKKIAVEESFWTTIFWEYIGLFIASLLLYSFIPSYRNNFHLTFEKNRVKVVGLNLFNESINIISMLALSYASLLAPLAIVVFVAEGFQPLFVLVLGLLLTWLFPKIIEEDISLSKVAKKTVSILVMLVGVYFLRETLS